MIEPEPIRKTRLRSGLRLVTERLPERSGPPRSAAGSAAGSRDEPEHLAGASHFLEHLLFKGTERRTARRDRGDGRDRRRRDERVHHPGADRVLRARPRLEPSRSRSTCSPTSCGRRRSGPTTSTSERQVILEEIRHARRHARRSRPRPVRRARCSPVTRSVARCSASRETIQAMTRDDIAGFHAGHYHPTQRRDRGRGQPRPRRRSSSWSEAALVGVDGRRPPRSHHDGEPPPPSRGRPRARHRAGPPRARHAVARTRRPRPLRADRREPGARRRDVVAPVPGGARAARARVLRVLVPRRVRRTPARSRSTPAPRPSGSPSCST